MGETYFITIEHKGLTSKIEAAMLDEMKIAKAKWRVYLSSKEEEEILRLSRLQLIAKVQSITKDMEWSIDDKISIYPVRVEENSRLVENLSLPNDSRKRDIHLLEVNDGWKIDNDNSIESTPLFKFEERVVTRILEWARTAVFYGVGSYKGTR